MRTINIQFHMLPHELVEFVSEVAFEHHLTVELERWTPTACQSVTPGTDLRHAITGFGNVDRIWLLIRPPRSNKVERCMLNMSTSRGNKLQQAQFGIGTNNKYVYGIATAIASKLRKRTRAGAWVVSEGGHVGRAKEFRISDAAAEASRSGAIELTTIGFLQSIRPEIPV